MFLPQKHGNNKKDRNSLEPTLTNYDNTLVLADELSFVTSLTQGGCDETENDQINGHIRFEKNTPQPNWTRKVTESETAKPYEPIEIFSKFFLKFLSCV